jgi:radical SAM superfamily enzyme YgiQ (UPF0313 family)/GT2 family glycosyltransferase/MoaA/NifB/PqqE/SkfB family radical SAM enzyme/glycosyltransferase involved in cell wall biosynthesis
MKVKAPRVVVVLGMHRSGTSAITRGLFVLGADLGDNLMAPGHDNEKGYWEDLDVLSVNEEALDILKAKWDSPGIITDRAQIALAASGLADRAGRILRHKAKRGSIFAMKDPRTARLISFWQHIFAKFEFDVSYVLACRHPISVARSLETRNGFDPAKSCLLWLQHVVPMLQKTQGMPRIVIDYDCLMDNPRHELRRLAEFLHTPFDEKIPAIAQYCENFLEDRLRHHRSDPDELDSRQNLPPYIREIHESLQRLAQDENLREPVKALGKATAWISQSASVADLLQRAEALAASRQESLQKREGELERMHGQLSETTDRTGALIAALANSQQENALLLNKLRQAQAQAEESKARIAIGEDRLHAVLAERDELDRRNDALEKEKSARDDKLDELTRQNAALEKEITGRDGKLGELACRNTALERAIIARDDKLGVQAMHLASALDDASCFEARQATDQQNIVDLRQELLRLSEALEQRDHELKNMQAVKLEAERLAGLSHSLEQALKAAQTETTQQSEMVQAERDRGRSLADAITVLEKQRASLRAEINDRERVIAEMQLSASWRLTKPLRLTASALARRGRNKRAANPAKPPSSIPARIEPRSAPVAIVHDGLDGGALLFNASPSPDVSIIIPLYKHYEDTMACLRSISQNSGAGYTYEIIAPDDGIDEPIAHLLPMANGLHASLNERNLGFVWNCKTAARQAKGRYLLFLNSDTLVGPDWLAPLVRIADSDDKIGIVGAKLLNPDGTIQDAGWSVLANGWGVPIGRNGDASEERYNYVREVDCVVGACLLTRRSLYEEVGGFDPIYAPAFYEEFDYAFTLRSRGYKVMYQPASQVVHMGSASYGVEMRDRLSAINHDKFARKWDLALQSQPASCEDEFLVRESVGHRPIILCIDDKLPEYDRHAGGLTIDQYLTLLLRMGWRVVFAPFDGEPREPYAQRLRQKGIELVTARTGLADWLDKHGRHLSVVWTARPEATYSLLPLLRDKTQARILYYTHDLHYLREQRRYEIERDPSILVTAATVRNWEFSIFSSVDRIMSPSEEEAQIIRQEISGADVVCIPPYLYPPGSGNLKTPDDFKPLQDIVFVGGFPHLPNVDAALWLVNEIMPLVWAEEPEARLLLIGNAPPPQIETLRGPHVVVTGMVPDLAPYFENARLSVSPLRYGAGVKGKIVTAMQSGVPIVTTSLGAEGIGLTDDHHALIADDGRALSDRITRLLREPETCARLANAASTLIEERFSETAGETIMKRILAFHEAQDSPNARPSDLAAYFCGQPWTTIEIYDGGVFPCCPAWNHNTAIGNIFTDGPQDIWNGSQAQLYRKGVLNGSFDQCDKEKCNLILDRRLSLRDEVESKHLGHVMRAAIDRQCLVMDSGPRVVKLGYDSSCNLACPSCRSKIIVADKNEQARLDGIFQQRVLPVLDNAELLLLSSDGDPFASRHYRQVLKTTAARFPGMKLGLSTNGLLLDEKAWNDCLLEGRVAQIQLSIDAATKQTYEKLRAPGKIARLLDNLDFLSQLRSQRRFGRLEFLFVVQATNFREMADFVRMGEKYGADAVSFLLIDQWSRGMTGASYRLAKVWDAEHPDYAEFARLLTDPIFSSPIVQLNGLRGIREGIQPPEITVTNQGQIERKGHESKQNSALVKFLSVFKHSLTRPENLDHPDIVLVQAPGWGMNTPPLATAMLTAYLRSCNFKVLPLDLNLEFFAARPTAFEHAWDMEQALWFWKTRESVTALLSELEALAQGFVETVVASGAKVVGFTLYESSCLLSLDLARRLKARNPDLLVIMGGPHASKDIAGTSLIEHAAVDAVAQGEGEELLAEVLERLRTHRSLDDCPGLLLKRDAKTVFDTGPRKQITPLNGLPDADFSDYSFGAYLTPNKLPIMGSRGCPNRCIYCSERAFWISFRFRSAESIFAEIKRQLKLYPFLDFVEFQDSLVNGKISVLERLADLIVQSGLKIHWSGQAVIRKEMTLELLVKLKRSGCVCLAYGLETPSPQLMRHIGKRLSLNADIDAIAQAHGRAGLDAVYNVMFGLPGETEDDAFAVLEFLRRNKKHKLVVNPSASFCGFSPGTEGYERADEFGMDFSQGFQFWRSTDGTNTYLTRLKRFEDFCRLVAELGIETTYPATRLLDRNRTLGRYHETCGQPERARGYYKDWLLEHPEDVEIRDALTRVLSALKTEGEIPIPYPLPPSNDQNWSNGIATGWTSAFIVEVTEEARRDMLAGRTVLFPAGEAREIVRTEVDQGSLIVYFSGPPIDGAIPGHSPIIKVMRKIYFGEAATA